MNALKQLQGFIYNGASDYDSFIPLLLLQLEMRQLQLLDFVSFSETVSKKRPIPSSSKKQVPRKRQKREDPVMNIVNSEHQSRRSQRIQNQSQSKMSQIISDLSKDDEDEHSEVLGEQCCICHKPQNEIGISCYHCNMFCCTFQSCSYLHTALKRGKTPVHCRLCSVCYDKFSSSK